MTDKQIKKLNELTEMSQELGLYEDRPDWRITLQADHIKRLEEELQAKEQECEVLKAKCKKYGEINEQETKDYAELKSENKHLNDLLNQALKDYDNARQALTEIKEFFNEECIICKENYINITGEICEECKYKDILQKISEVIE